MVLSCGHITEQLDAETLQVGFLIAGAVGFSGSTFGDWLISGCTFECTFWWYFWILSWLNCWRFFLDTTSSRQELYKLLDDMKLGAYVQKLFWPNGIRQVPAQQWQPLDLQIYESVFFCLPTFPFYVMPVRIFLNFTLIDPLCKCHPGQVLCKVDERKSSLALEQGYPGITKPQRCTWYKYTIACASMIFRVFP